MKKSTYAYFFKGVMVPVTCRAESCDETKKLITPSSFAIRNHHHRFLSSTINRWALVCLVNINEEIRTNDHGKQLELKDCEVLLTKNCILI